MWEESVGAGSSGHTSARSSDISTNSRARRRLTIFGGSAAAGLYSPGACSCGVPSAGCEPCESVPVAGSVPWVPSCERAAAARTSRPGVDPPAGVNVGMARSRTGSGINPRLGPLGPAGTEKGGVGCQTVISAPNRGSRRGPAARLNRGGPAARMHARLNRGGPAARPTP